MARRRPRRQTSGEAPAGGTPQGGSPERRRWTRRSFLGASAALAAPLVVPSRLLGLGAATPPSEEVKVAIIGLGGRARGIWREIHGMKGLRLAGVCDCFKPRVDSFLRAWRGDSGLKGYEDFRAMIEAERPDGVMIETTTHARAWITIIAFQMGCDAYIEKPMSLTVAEGRAMVEAARALGRVTQVGTQQRSMALNNWASDLVRAGAIGTVHTVLAPNFVGPETWPAGGKGKSPMPGGGTEGWWSTWTNQAPLRPYHPEIHRGWMRWRDYDGGGLCFGVTGWGAHSFDQVNRGLGTDATGPAEIVLDEPVKVSPTGKFTRARGREDTGADYHAMAKPVIGPRAKVTMRFASGTVLRCHLDGDTGPGLGAIFIGSKGRIELNRGQVAADPPGVLSSAATPRPPGERGTTPHVRDWLRCIRSRGRCNADIEIGQRSTTLCHLVNIAREVGRVGEPLHWDPQHERFTDCDAANRLLERARRPGWELPRLA